RAAKNFRMHPPDGLKEPQVWPAQSLFFSDGDDDRRARVASFVDRMAQPRDKTPSGALLRDGAAGKRIPCFISGRQSIFNACQHPCQESARIFGDAQEARATA